MPITLAIHHRPTSFSERWIECCTQNGISHKVVDCYRSDIIHELSTVDGLLWHFTHASHQDLIIARHVIMSAERMGVVVYPNTATCWHFDDKIAQKYLLESVEAPLVPTYVSYNKEEALAWAEGATFPKVFKLRRGAGSTNVRLVHSRSQATWLIKRMFGRGFAPAGTLFGDLNTRVIKARRRGDLLGFIKRASQSFLIMRRINYQMSPERGYVYFQDFISGSLFDIRVTVIGDRAFGFTRNVRRNDFRASGSGSIDYDLSRVDLNCVRTAFDVQKKIGAQSIAFDFLLDENKQPRILELSYGFAPKPVYEVRGQWDRQMNWHEGHIWPQDLILTNLISEIEACKSSRP